MFIFWSLLQHLRFLTAIIVHVFVCFTCDFFVWTMLICVFVHKAHFNVQLKSNCYASSTQRRILYVLNLKYGPWSPRPCFPSNRCAYIKSYRARVTSAWQYDTDYSFLILVAYFAYIWYFCSFVSFASFRSSRPLFILPMLRTCVLILHLDSYTTTS